MIALALTFTLSELSLLIGPRWLAFTPTAPRLRQGLGVFLTGLLAFFLGRLTYLWNQEREGIGASNKQMLFFVLMTPLGIFTYYLIITGFARFVYPHIPVSKGGGDYTDAVPAILHARHQDADTLPDELRTLAPANKFQSDPVIVLLETGDYLYVVQDRPNERGMWGKGSSKGRPAIFQISRAGIGHIEFTKRP
jgi:hypothetical protein